MMVPNLDIFLATNGGCLPVLQLRRLIFSMALRGSFDDTKESSTSIDDFATEILSSCAARRPEGQRKRSKSADDPILDEEKPLAYMDHAHFVRLRDIADIRRGPTGIKDAVAGPYPLVVTAEARSSCDHYDFDAKAVLIPMVSSTGHGDASLKRIHYQEGKFALGSILCAVIPSHPELIYARYLYEYLAAFKDELLVSRMVGTANVSLTINKIGEIPVPIATPHAQRRVEELMRLCDLLEAHNRLQGDSHARLVTALFDSLAGGKSSQEVAESWQSIAMRFDLLVDRPEAIDALEQSILELAVRGLLVPQESTDEPVSELLARIRAEKHRQSEPGEIKLGKSLPEVMDREKEFGIPDSWCWIRLGEVIELISGQHLTPNEYSDRTGAGIPYLTGPADFGLYSPRPTRWTEARKAVAKSGDILITVKGSGVGKLNVVNQAELAISRQLMAIRPLTVLPSFVFLALETMYSKFQEKTVGIAIPGIGRDDVFNAVLALPPLAEQRRIVDRVDELRALCTVLRERLQQVCIVQSQLTDSMVRTVVQSHQC